MIIVEMRAGVENFIGRVGENQARAAAFPVGNFLREFPGASFLVLNRRPEDADAYPVNGSYVEVDGDVLYWTLQSGDLTTEGVGECALKVSKDGAVVKTIVYRTRIEKALDESGTAPDPWQSWVDQVAESAEDAEAWAVGTRDGEPVESDDPAYHNNAEYYAELAEETVNGKADKVTGATSGNFAGLDENGNLTDSGHKHSDYVTDVSGKADKVTSPTNGNFAALDSSGNLTDSGHKHSDYVTDVSGKADKVNSATNGNFAGLDGNGNLTDSGHKHSDYLTQHQDISGKADKVSSAVSGNFAGLDGNGNLTDSGHKHSDYLTSHQDISGKADKVASAVSGDFAGLDSNGNLTDSGKKAADFVGASDFYATEMPMSSGDSTKVSAEISSLKSALQVLEPIATSGDVGKFLKAKTVADGKVTEYEFGEGGSSVTVDSELSDSSTNPVQNRVITGEINIIEELQTQTETGYLTPFAQGSVSQSTGVIDTTSTTQCYIGKIQMKAGDRFTYSRSVNKIATSANLAIYNTSGTFISGRAVATGTTITFENDGMFAISCVLNSTVSATMEEAIAAANTSFSASFDKTKKIVATVNGHTSDIVSIESDIGKMHGLKFTQSNMKTGIYYKVTNGVVSEQTESTAKYLHKVDVSAFRGMRMHIWINAKRSGSSRSFGFCDSNGNVGNYKTEGNCLPVADGGYYQVLIIDKDYMFFSCSGDPSTIRIEISDSNSSATRSYSDNAVDNKRFYHMSFDDVITCLQDITTNASTYESIFENDLFGWCKEMHDLYGTTFSMYVFYQNASSSPTWTLEDCTDAFSGEFSANADWLRFGYHAYYQGTNATTREATAASDYSAAITQLVRITGSAKCIDRIPRLHEYSGTLTALKAMRDCDVGCVGFIASADYDLTTPRDSYYFDSDENAYIYKHIYLYDAENHLNFVKTSYLWISSSASVIDKENSTTYFDRSRFVEMFMHESSMTSGYKSSCADKFCQLSYSHRPYFMMDQVLTN